MWTFNQNRVLCEVGEIFDVKILGRCVCLVYLFDCFQYALHLLIATPTYVQREHLSYYQTGTGFFRFPYQIRYKIFRHIYYEH